MRACRFVVGAWLVLMAAAFPASAARVALVIGNDGYASVKPLVRAAADAEAMHSERWLLPASTQTW